MNVVTSLSHSAATCVSAATSVLMKNLMKKYILKERYYVNASHISLKESLSLYVGSYFFTRDKGVCMQSLLSF